MPKSCRICSAPLQTTFCDLGTSPLANSYVTKEQVKAGLDRWYPLHAYACDQCGLVQLEAMETPEAIFSDYAYFSSYSASAVEAARSYCDSITQRLALAAETAFVVEIGSNDGYLLQHFVRKGIRVLGIEPAENVAEAARKKGVRTETKFFGERTARDVAANHGRADLIIGNNVIAHVPDLHDFIEGVRVALSERGTATFEFPHLLRLIEQVQFDTIYHEHFSYFALKPLQRAFNAHHLEVVDVEEIPAHGGSLRVYVQHEPGAAPSRKLEEVLRSESAARLDSHETYRAFQEAVKRVRDDLVDFLTRARAENLCVVAYGAPAKGVTLLNYCHVDSTLLPYTADINPNKAGRLLPGCHIPILSPEKIRETRPDIVLILAWNLQNEIREQLKFVNEWGGRFAVAVPQLQVFEGAAAS